MSFSTASAYTLPSSSSTPSSPNKAPAMLALKDAFAEVNDLTAWRHCLGVERLNGIPAIANELANHTIVVCLDCEHWSTNSDETTEIGIGTFSTQSMFPLVQGDNLGDHGENLMKRIKFYLLRTIETSHLPKTNPNSRGVEGNRFGQGRFVTFSEARNILHNVFAQPITDVNSLKGYNHPIVVLGHDISHDKDNLKEKDVAFDIDALGTVVRYIDTQVLARDVKFWLKPKEKIGLANLVKSLWFEHSDSHTAANDVGRTVISAVQLALHRHTCKRNCNKTMLEVATKIEDHSRLNFASIGGSTLYCWKCGSHNHMHINCRATGLHCNECWSKGRYQEARTHITLHCMHLAWEKATARRQRHDQARAAYALARQPPRSLPRYAAPPGPQAYYPNSFPAGYTHNPAPPLAPGMLTRPHFPSPGGFPSGRGYGRGNVPPGPGAGGYGVARNGGGVGYANAQLSTPRGGGYMGGSDSRGGWGGG
ncbi:uncharacterized protein K460DRAFT_422461 [Cucurbitaria berberidis CBS 394.84]|uniref:Gfd2/YDR514C-like C-terminal domain-containing protein n=1 Tax=Cucurbitaria berberidis CBS 394.84 TaxID=1168544 RepID=A0A9P4LD66_9PLEO|nr:uncharacterized protein K460DRAFT_422461 [Cucurbitaria berberidis CBS 394.84]KAF1850072.1 hypothetical protein K460DRAFT_422461 [Cucurbitaria berberidis CBS 394.84]